METIFNKIPTAQSVREWLNEATQNAIRDFVERATKALENLSSEKAVLQAKTGDHKIINGIASENLRNEFRKKWWEITYHSEQRDGDYITIKMIESGTHQWDR